MKTLALCLCAVAVMLLLQPRTTAAWVVTPEIGYGLGIALAPDGDLLSCGQSIDAGGRYDFSVRRQRAADGSDLWHYRVDDGAAFEIAVDGAGDILAGGFTASGPDADVQIVKLSPSGAPRWTRRIDSLTHQNDVLNDMAIAPGNDVLATGRFSMTEGAGVAFSIVRLAGATGEPIWQHDVPMPIESTGVTVGFDGAGDVLAAGNFLVANTTGVVAVKVAGATGEERWRTLIDGEPSGMLSSNAAAIDAAGDLYLGVRTFSTKGDGLTVVKLSGANGAILWRHDHVSRNDGEPWMLALDGAGHLYVGGHLLTARFGHDAFVIEKLSVASGTPVWSNRVSNATFTSLALDPAGDILLAGANSGGLFTLQKLRASNGRKRWQRKLPGTRYDGGYATGVTTDASGAVYAVGGDVVGSHAAGENAPYSYAVVKACGGNGRTSRTDACR